MNKFFDHSVNKSQLIDRRQFFLSISKVIIFSGIVARLFTLQISETKKYTTLSDKNRLREWKILPKRGIFEDYFGKKIADNNQVFQLHLIPENVEDSNLLFFKLKNIIDLNDKKINLVKKKMNGSKPWEPIIISDNLNWSEFSRLNLFLHELPGAKPIVSIARNYPQKNNFSHVIGYVSDISNKDLNENIYLREFHLPGLKVGKNGLEKSFNNDLIGSTGLHRYEVNAYGKKIKEIYFVDGQIGKNYKTTLDSEVQAYSAELMKDKSGSVCVMDIFNGDVVAMVSSPSFDPNLFVHGISRNDWNQLLSNKMKPLLNKSVSALYPPGSTIKPLVALSALEFNTITTKRKIRCKGVIELYGTKYHCWKEKGHGYLNLREAIKQSCDVFFYETVRLLGVDRLSKTATKFGLGQKVFKNLKEEKIGIVPNTKWKLNNIGRGWVLGETLITGIGQGYIQTTPIQICLMTAQLANGGFKIQPKLIVENNEIDLKKEILKWEVKTSSNTSEEKKFSMNEEWFNNINSKILFRNQENIKFVQDALFGATNEPKGTSFKSRYIDKKYIYAGKTGTSQVTRFTEKQREEKVKNEDLPYEKRDHALFTAFAPYKNPQYAISIIIEHGGSGSTVAAPIAKKIIKKVLDRHSLRKLRSDKVV